MTTGRCLAVLALALAACGEPSHEAGAQVAHGASLFASAAAQQWALPAQMREVSGLAVSANGGLFGHDDERAVIYQLDARAGALVKTFALGNPAETGDFEGLAITPEGTFWLTTSQGKLYRFSEGGEDAHVTFAGFDTGLSQICEVEGLAYLAAEESLILACKQNEARAMRNTIALYAWRTDGSAPAVLWRRMDVSEVAEAAGVRRFQPSSVEIDAESGRIVLLSARDGAMAEFSPAGVLVAARSLGREHAQAEGAAILADGTLVIADEAAGGRAMLSLYDRTP